jgi:hypothetical protein
VPQGDVVINEDLNVVEISKDSVEVSTANDWAEGPMGAGAVTMSSSPSLQTYCWVQHDVIITDSGTVARMGHIIAHP